eukprot:Hpha_TRINITY_DN36439_c0_g1::TRINITY_DN36439_c0_g1_i1::g.20141::m.20141
MRLRGGKGRLYALAFPKDDISAGRWLRDVFGQEDRMVLHEVKRLHAQLREAVRVLEDEGVPVRTATNRVAIALLGQGREGLRFALSWFRRRGVPHNASTYAAVIGAAGRAKDVATALKLWREMVQGSVDPDVTTYHALLLTFANTANRKGAEAVTAEMERQGLPISTVTHTLALRSYGDDWEAAKAAWEALVREGVMVDEGLVRGLA